MGIMEKKMETTIMGYTQCNSSGNAASYDVIPNKMLRELIASFSVKNLGPSIPYRKALSTEKQRNQQS